jgi:uncharacterized protein (DUF1499 family)
MGFVDDLECVLDEHADVIQVRSSSRLFHFQIIFDYVDFALPCRQYCLRLVFAPQLIWKWN